MTTKISLIPTEHCGEMVDHIYHMLSPAVEKSSGRWTMTNVFDGLVSGRQQLWIIFEDSGTFVGCCTTMIKCYPSLKMLEIIFLGGVNFDEWSDSSVEILKSYAQDCGCAGVETIGRKGFLKPMKGRGFNTPYVVYENLFERIQP